MDRRAFIGGVSCALILVPLAARAQTAKTVRRIGVLGSGAQPTPDEFLQAYAPLRELGWVEGQNLLVERRYANGRAELLRPLAEELVRLKVEIIVTDGTPATLAAKNATTTIPIIMGSAGDPVGAGFVASLARPGGNITGFSIVSPEIDAKRLSLLRELLPGLQRVGVLENAIAELARRRAQALFVQRDGLFYDNRVPLLSAALRYALPTLGTYKEMLEAGALVSYAHSDAENLQRYAAFVDRILRGAKPADLPIEQPTRFDLGINLKTAK